MRRPGRAETVAYTLPACLRDPAFRYRHAGLIHAARVAAGIFIGLGLVFLLHVPDGEWTAISLLIVMVGLQHQGNIQRRAMERAAGTLFGALAGFAAIGVQTALGITPLTIGLMALFCGACGYYAIGRGGYVAQLSAITLVIVAGFGTDPLSVGAWRTVNVLLGIVIALGLTWALPIYATSFWRFGMADALRRCARVLAAAGSEAEAPAGGIETISPVLQKLRGLMVPVARETGIAMSTLEAVQRSLRLSLSLLELATGPEHPAAAVLPHARLTREEAQRLAARLEGIAAGLETGAWALPWQETREQESVAAQLIGAELARLRAHLLDAPQIWTL